MSCFVIEFCECSVFSKMFVVSCVVISKVISFLHVFSKMGLDFFGVV